MLYVDLFDSKAIAMFAYDPGTQSLLVGFKTGGTYAYQDVPRAIFERFRQAPSKGQFFQSTIRDRFAARRLSPSEAAAIARLHAHGSDCAAPGIGRVDIAALARPCKAAVFF